MLSLQEVEQFHTLGVIGPYTAMDPNQMDLVRRYLDKNVIKVEPTLYNLHSKIPAIYKLAADREITNRIQSIYGPNLICWRSAFFIKNPKTLSEISWHQDTNFWQLNPQLSISAWLAIDDCNEANSSVQIIPGSHWLDIPHIENMSVFQKEADPKYFKEENVMNMNCRAGQFFLFNEKVLHRSIPNQSDKRRAAISFRYTVPFVFIKHPTSVPVLVSGTATNTLPIPH